MHAVIRQPDACMWI